MLQRLLRASKTTVFRLRFDLIGGRQASASLLSHPLLSLIAHALIAHG